MTDDRWRACAVSWGIGDLAEALRPNVVPCVRVVSTEPAAAVLGSSRLAGAPDLPRGASWPTVDGASLSFVAQINLAELQRGWIPDVPGEGWLWLFVDTTRNDGRFPHVLLFADVPTTGLASTPRERADWTARSPVFESSFALASLALDDDRLHRLPPLGTAIGGCGPTWCTSGKREAALHALGLGEAAPFHHMSDAQLQDLINLHRDARPEWAREYARFLEEVVRPKLLVRHENRAEIDRRAENVRTLLLVASEPDVGWGWGDAGTLEVLIDADDLRGRRFDRTHLRLCSS